MRESDEAAVETKVTRYDIARLRFAQLLIPLAIGATIVARRAPTMVTQLSAFAMLGIALVVFASAAKRFGWQPLRFEDGAIVVGSTGIRIERKQVREWTLVGGVARLYGGDTSSGSRLAPA